MVTGFLVRVIKKNAQCEAFEEAKKEGSAIGSAETSKRAESTKLQHVFTFECLHSAITMQTDNTRYELVRWECYLTNTEKNSRTRKTPCGDIKGV